MGFEGDGALVTRAILAVSSPVFQNELTLLYSDLKSIPILIKVLEADGCGIREG